MMSLWDALRMNMMISYQELVRTFPKTGAIKKTKAINIFFIRLSLIKRIDQNHLKTYPAKIKAIAP